MKKAEADQGYLAMLQDELRDALRRAQRADPEGLPVVKAQIRESAWDIFAFVQDAQSKNIAPDDIEPAIETIETLRRKGDPHGKSNIPRPPDPPSGSFPGL